MESPMWPYNKHCYLFSGVTEETEGTVLPTHYLVVSVMKEDLETGLLGSGWEMVRSIRWMN